MSPISNFRKVDLPTPLGPSIATRELKSIPKSASMNNDFCPWYPNVTPARNYIHKNIQFVFSLHCLSLIFFQIYYKCNLMDNCIKTSYIL